jgi:hypothetical protein
MSKEYNAISAFAADVQRGNLIQVATSKAVARILVESAQMVKGTNNIMIKGKNADDLSPCQFELNVNSVISILHLERSEPAKGNDPEAEAIASFHPTPRAPSIQVPANRSVVTDADGQPVKAFEMATSFIQADPRRFRLVELIKAGDVVLRGPDGEPRLVVKFVQHVDGCVVRLTMTSTISNQGIFRSFFWGETLELERRLSE